MDLVKFRKPEICKEVDLLVVGAGPAGLSAAIRASQLGIKTLIVDSGLEPGGQLVKQTHKFFGSSAEYAGTRGINIAKILRKELENQISEGKADLMLRTTALGIYDSSSEGSLTLTLLDSRKLPGKVVLVKTRALIIATGAQERMIPFPNNDLPGIYGAGGLQTLMNTYGVIPGKRALIVGAGNIGLILAYQLLQTNVEVLGVVEYASKIGGWWVHAAKIRRYGIPILLRHTVSRAIGEGELEGVVIAEVTADGLKERYEVECDVLALAVGLTPSSELLFQAKVEMRYNQNLGGWVPIRDRYMRTTHPRIWVAGDVAGIEEASTAMIEGRISALGVAKSLGVIIDESELEEYHERLEMLRSAEVSTRVRQGLKEVFRDLL